MGPHVLFYSTTPRLARVGHCDIHRLESCIVCEMAFFCVCVIMNARTEVSDAAASVVDDVEAASSGDVANSSKAAASSDTGQPGLSRYATAGTAAQLIATGTQRANVCCTRVSFNQGKNQGWIVLCSAHALQQSDEARSLTARPDPLPQPTRVPLQQPVASTSISARFRQQIKKKKRASRTSGTASRGDCATDYD